MMTEADLIKTEAHILKQFEGEGTGHDWWHIKRVHDMAQRLATEEQANVMVVRMAALLHDIADHKFHGGDEKKSGVVARTWLESLGVSEDEIVQVVSIIDEVSYKGAKVATPVSTIEAACVQDADRLDAMGAIGIARAFAYGGAMSRPLYVPGDQPTLHVTFDEYKNDKGHTINHFYEKLLLLKHRMNTETAKYLAHKRHVFMEGFLERFHEEWVGKE